MPGRYVVAGLALWLTCLTATAAEAGADFLVELDTVFASPLPVAEIEAPSSSPSSPIAVPGSSTAESELYPEVRVRVTSKRHAILSSQASGRVDRVTVRNGDRFEEGDILIEIDPTFERIQLDRARANLRRQELLMEMVREMVELQARGELELEMARTDIEQAKAEVNLLTARLERMRIVAPYAGRAGEVAVRELQVVAEGQALMEIIGDGAMELEFIVSSEWMRWFTPGYEFTVHIDELGKSYRAVVERLGGKVDPLSRSINVYARLVDADSLLMEGMSGEARIEPPRKE